MTTNLTEINRKTIYGEGENKYNKCSHEQKADIKNNKMQ